MVHLQTIQTTNHVSPNMHKIPKLQINQHKVKNKVPKGIFGRL